MKFPAIITVIFYNIFVVASLYCMNNNLSNIENDLFTETNIFTECNNNSGMQKVSYTDSNSSMSYSYPTQPCLYHTDLSQILESCYQQMPLSSKIKKEGNKRTSINTTDDSKSIEKICSVCPHDAVPKNKLVFIDHYLTLHSFKSPANKPQAKPYNCIPCPKVHFPSESHLKKHILSFHFYGKRKK